MNYTYGDTLLEINQVSLTYDKPVLRGINASIQKIISDRQMGQVVSFLGFSGVGKTQLLRIISGLKKPDSGVVKIRKKDLVPVESGDVGVVAQNYPLFMHRTVLGNLKQACSDETKINEYLKLYNLEEHKHKYPAQLSGGQRQRIAILQMILKDHEFIVMDEPFSGLDMINLERTCQTISEMSGHGSKTIIVVTHDITSAASISDHVFMLGHERDQNGNPIPGAKVVAAYDLLQEGLYYRPGIITEPYFMSFVSDIKEKFRTLI